MSTQPPSDAQELLLLRTKLYSPPSRREQVLRPRLFERLNAGLRRKLTLVSAPAGFGKTTLVGEWAQARDDVAWVSLDAGDSDPARFWRYVIAALQTVGLSMQATLAAWQAQPGAAETFLTSLINDITAIPPDRDVVLVLDDYHLVETGSIHDGLDYLLVHLPPAMHVFITTREDPPLSLSRLRGRGQLVEVRAADLRFTPQETAEFLSATMGLDLSSDQVVALERRTEGWIVGLQMAALSLQGQSGADRQRFVDAFAGDDHYVADYLIDEVLRRQSPQVQRFLVETSILDRLCGPLCDAILVEEVEIAAETAGQETLIQRRASPSQEILDHLLASNLFVVSLDSQRRWFRYHRLFSDLLYSRLEEHYPERIAGNHARASAWHEEQGAISEAVSHALKAGDTERAADLVERYSRQALVRGENWQLRHWLDALPEEIIRSRPLLCMARGWALWIGSDGADRTPLEWLERGVALSAANPRMFRDLDGVERSEHDVISASAYVVRISFERQQADPDRSIALCLEALEALPEEETFLRGIVTLWLAQTYGMHGDQDDAQRALDQAQRLGMAAEGHLVALVVAGAQARQAWNRGDLRGVARIYREAMASLIAPAEQAGERLPFACDVYVSMGRTLVEWNELERAQPLLVRGIELAKLALDWEGQTNACRDLALLHWIQGAYSEAHAWMDEAVRAWQGDPAFLHALRARIWLAQAEDDPQWLDAAVQWADGYALDEPEEYPWGLQSWVRVRLAQHRACGEPDLVSVLSVLQERMQVDLGSSGWQVQMPALRALLLQALGRTEEAMPSLAHALAVAEETGRVLVFLEHGPPMAELLREAVRRDVEAGYARRLLGAFADRQRIGKRQAGPPSPEAAPSAQADLVEPLSARELQVLRLLATTLSGPEIADELTISLSTFRSHTKSIYGKLDAHSRLDAVDRARALGLLPDPD